MNSREKKTKIFLFMAFTVFMIFFLFAINKKEEAELAYTSHVMEMNLDDSKPMLAVYYPLSRSMKGASDFFVRWWYNLADNKYYLFLPSGIEDKNVCWMLEPDTNVWINQEKVENGDIFNLPAGDYEVEIEGQEEYQSVSLQIMQSRDIPSLFIETASGTLDYIHEQKGNEESGTYTILSPKGKLLHGGNLEKLRGRGNVTWDADKRAYQMTLENKTELLSMAEEKQWILNPNTYDFSLLKNKICYDLARGLEMPFTPELEYIDLYINGEYLGNYLLMEKTEIGENRVDIRNLEKETEMLNEEPLETMERFDIAVDEKRSYKGCYIPNQPEDITGGYLLEMEITPRYHEECSGFVSGLKQKIVIKSPQYASYEQMTYISNKYQEFEDALFAEDGLNPDTGKHYSEYLDIDSAINKYIVEEVSKNLDTGLTSQYLYKYEDSVSNKFYLGPVWDFDKTLGTEGISRTDVDLSIPEEIHAGTPIRESHILYGLYQKEDFRKSLIETFETKAIPIIVKELTEVIPATQERIYDSARMNLVRWNYYGDIPLEEKIEYYKYEGEKIKFFLGQRVEFLKTEWNIE